jgi:hypothetical protein
LGGKPTAASSAQQTSTQLVAKVWEEPKQTLRFALITPIQPRNIVRRQKRSAKNVIAFDSEPFLISIGWWPAWQEHIACQNAFKGPSFSQLVACLPKAITGI